MTTRNLALVGLLAATALGAAGCAMNALPAHDNWYAQHYFLMQDYERSAYKDLAPAARQQFQALFWSSRAPAAKGEFDARMQFIQSQFKGENSGQPWNTDRARVYLLNGRPAGFERRVNDAWGTQINNAAGNTSQERSGEDIQAATVEVWNYKYNQFVVSYAFTFQAPNKWKQTQSSFGGSRYIGELETLNRTTVFGVGDEGAYKKALEELKAVK